MAQASGRDVRDILEISNNSGPGDAQRLGQASGLAGSSTAPSTSRPPVAPPRPPTLKKTGKARGRSDAIHKELQALLGDNAPSLALAQSEARSFLGQQEGESGKGFRPKFKRKERKAKKWALKPFQSASRADGLVLHHWMPTEENADEYERETGIDHSRDFSIFNTTSGAYSYSNEEYQQHLKDDDWTKDETDYLIDLCQRYDLRFVVIADRWEWPASSHKQRSMEDLKARYYAICRRLIRSRISVEDMDSRQQLLQTYAFDKTRELERKRLLQRLFTRTPVQLAEEEALYVEARRLEQNEAKFSADREDLLKLLGGWERVPNVSGSLIAEAGAGIGLGAAGPIPGTPGAAAEDALVGSDGKRKKRRIGDGSLITDDDAASTSGRSTAATTTTLTAKQKAELKQAQFDEACRITRFDPEAAPLARPPYPFLIGTPSTAPPVAPSPNNPSSSHGVYLRSARVLAPRQPQYNRTMQTLAEMKASIGPKLVFPTRQNCEKWEGLLGAVTSGLEMKKQTDRVESELRIAKNRLIALQQAAKEKNAAGGQGHGSAAKHSAAQSGSGGQASRRSVTPRVSTQQKHQASSAQASSDSRARSGRSRTPATATTFGLSVVSNSGLDSRPSTSKGSVQDDQSENAGSEDDDDDDDDDDEDVEWKDAKDGHGRPPALATEHGNDDA
ncbi:unnamed protein product [Parajaminaea phylloscopi]